MSAPPDTHSPPLGSSDTPPAPAPMFKWPFLAAMFVVVVGLFASSLFLPSRSTKSQLIVPPDANQAVTSPTPIKVHVIGEVVSPGLYECRPKERIQDVITRAGGATPNANINAINLSAFLEDGQQITIPSLVAATPDIAPTPTQTPLSPELSTSPGQPLDLNTATLDQLDTLPEVGPATANSILKLRQERGRFKSVEELDDVPGIGEKKLEQLRSLVTVN